MLWFPDLTAVDSTWILPISVGVVNLLIVEVSGLRWGLLTVYVIGIAAAAAILASHTL